MSISNKIILLIIFLFCVLAANTWVGLRQMNKIRFEFNAMATDDIGLMESVTAIHEIQLQKSILLQRLIGIAEELGFEQINFSRKSYLHDQLRNMQEELILFANQASTHHLKARQIAVAAYDLANDQEQRGQLKEMLLGLNSLDAARQAYNESIDKILTAVKAGGFQLSLEDLEDIQRQENMLSKDVGDLLKKVQAFARLALQRAEEWEKKAQYFLGLSLWLTVVLGCLLAFWIVRSIVRPLKALGQAARQVGSGDFKVALPTTSRDELAQVSQAFNTMSQQLEEFKNRLEKKNQDLISVNEDLDKFIHVMAHDILDPLTMMIAYCSYLELHAGKDMDQKNLDSLQGIRKAATKMHAMVKDLLKFTESKRFQNPNQQLNPPSK